MNTRKGTFRRVLLARSLAVKIPRIRHPLAALRCNRWEREMWRKWRKKFRWDCLCPVLIADPLGFVVIMRRAATVGVSAEEVAAGDPDAYPDITCEWKPDDCGRLDGRIVAVDYCDLPSAQAVRERRAYYARFPS